MPCVRIKDGLVCEISYITEAAEAEKRIKRGEKQLYWRTCKRWVWPEDYVIESHRCKKCQKVRER